MRRVTIVHNQQPAGKELPYKGKAPFQPIFNLKEVVKMWRKIHEIRTGPEVCDVRYEGAPADREMVLIAVKTADGAKTVPAWTRRKEEFEDGRYGYRYVPIFESWLGIYRFNEILGWQPLPSPPAE